METKAPSAIVFDLPNVVMADAAEEPVAFSVLEISAAGDGASVATSTLPGTGEVSRVQTTQFDDSVADILDLAVLDPFRSA